MNSRLMLPIPAALEEKAQEQAERTNRSVFDVLLDKLNKGFSLPDEEEDLEETESIFSVDPNRAEMSKQVAAYAAMKDELLKKYEGQYVAIHQEKLVDVDTDEMALVKRVYENYDDDDIVHIRRVTRGEDRELRNVSFRFVPK